jgi:hypothetical protein
MSQASRGRSSIDPCKDMMSQYFLSFIFIPHSAFKTALLLVSSISIFSFSSDDNALRTRCRSCCPVVGSWPRRPLELATLRLQSMLGISLANWQDLAPDQEALDAGVLTQLGGCLIVDNDKAVFEWKDPGICAVANFEDIMKKI